MLLNICSLEDKSFKTGLLLGEKGKSSPNSRDCLAKQINLTFFKTSILFSSIQIQGAGAIKKVFFLCYARCEAIGSVRICTCIKLSVVLYIILDASENEDLSIQKKSTIAYSTINQVWVLCFVFFFHITSAPTLAKIKFL